MLFWYGFVTHTKFDLMKEELKRSSLEIAGLSGALKDMLILYEERTGKLVQSTGAHGLKAANFIQ